MRKLYILLPFLFAAWTASAAAQEIWAYAVVGPDNKAEVKFRPPIDLTYPLPGAPMPVVGPLENPVSYGIRLTPQEAARRLSASRVIIMLLPAQQAINMQRYP